MIELDAEKLNEIKQWISLGHSRNEIAKTYGLKYSQVYRLAMMYKHGTWGRGVGRKVLSADVREKIIEDLKDTAKRHVDIALACQVHPLTVTRIAKENNLMRRKGHRRGSKYKNVEFGVMLADV